MNFGMKHPLPPLDGLKAFEAAARHLSFSLAADELCITKGAISYQIRKLEEHLQCTLFKRSVRQVLLTDAGQLLLPTTQQLFGSLAETLARLQGDNERATVNVGATTYVAARWLSRRISAFNEVFPDADIVLQHSVNSKDFKLNEVDLAIRWGPCRGENDNVRFGEIPMPLYAAMSPVLFDKVSRQCELHSSKLVNNELEANDTTINDKKIHDAACNNEWWLTDAFASLVLLCEDRQQDLWIEWWEAIVGKKMAQKHPLKNTRRIISDANVRVQAAIDGQGLILADELVQTEVKNQLLVTPFAQVLNGYGYALMHSDSRILSANASALKSWLVDDFATHNISLSH